MANRAVPIKDIETIELIKSLYKQKDSDRDLLLFLLGINTGLSLKDLLKLKVGDVKNKLYLVHDGKYLFPLSKEIMGLVSLIIQEKNDTDYLFTSQRNKVLDRTMAFKSFQEVCKELALKNISVASWRKTFAYHFYQKYKDLSFLQWLFNQHSPEITLKFIDVEENLNLRLREGVCL